MTLSMLHLFSVNFFVYFIMIIIYYACVDSAPLPFGMLIIIIIIIRLTLLPCGY